MLVIVVGGGRTGSQLARVLIKQNHEVRVIEDRRDVLSRIHRELPTEVILEGSATNLKVLEKAGIAHADVLAAVTTSDEDNLVLCYIARSMFGVHRTIARVNNPRDSWLYTNLFHVDVSVNQADIMAHLIEEEMSMGDMMTLLKLRRGNYSLVEEKVPPCAIAIGVAIKDLKLPEHCVIAAIVRKGEVIVPRGVTVFEEADEVLAITDLEGKQELMKLFCVNSDVKPKSQR
jgi:trk system potassium uptake protein